MDWNVNWDDLTRVYLHDPPDKILDLATHVGRAREYARTVLGKDFPEGEIYELADQLSSALERMPAPSSQTLVIGPSDGKLLVYHPLTGRAESPEPDWLDLPNLEPRRIQEVLEQLTRDLSQPEKFLALWRLLPERLSEIHPSYLRLPADTRCPDHTIWHHLDICAAVFAAETGGQGPAFLSFALGPVQQFIATARSLRDLWSGSMILSWLTFRAMLPIIEACGPTSIIYPALRGIPLLDLWLRRRSARLAQLIPQPSVEMRQAPCLPNRFLALVPYGPDGEYANGLAQRCEQALRQAWRELTDAVHYALDPILSSLDNDWDKRWQAQLDSFWDIRTAVLPWRALSDNELAELICGVADFGEAFPDAQKVRQLAESIPQEQRPKFAQNQAGWWQARQELSARLMQALRAVRHVPTYSPLTDGTWVPPKCSLMGTYEQMGPDGLDASREFWRQAEKKLIVGGVRLRRAERLCAVALVKRFAAPAFFLRELELTRQDLRFADIASVALAEWLLRFGKLQNYSKERLDSTWVYWQHNYKAAETAEDEDEEVVEPVPDDIWQELRICRRRVPPPTYYAILMVDGDHMGSWLRGDMSPRVRDVLHPELVAYYERLGGPVAHLLEAKRPIGPALHAALSTALSNFALHFVPQIVENYQGTLVYAGGDDVLALLPTAQALYCAYELRTTYRQKWARNRLEPHYDRLLMGTRATCSAGLVVAHHKEDLRYALQQARRAEKEAKDAGRDALRIFVLRRSGEPSAALCPWDFIPVLNKLVDAFIPRPNEPEASDRWIYHLYSDLDVLEALDYDAVASEIRRQVKRSEESTRQRLAGGDPRKAPEVLVNMFDEYHQLTRTRFDHPRIIREFVTLLHIAAFLARGREL